MTQDELNKHGVQILWADTQQRVFIMPRSEYGPEADKLNSHGTPGTLITVSPKP
jgi:hypothetical protein